MITEEKDIYFLTCNNHCNLWSDAQHAEFGWQYGIFNILDIYSIWTYWIHYTFY